MKTTYFKPSIHGWPFGNSYDYELGLSFFLGAIQTSVTLNNVGFCGGMCWTALTRFFNGTLVDRGTTSIPTEGDQSGLYDEIKNAQLASLSDETLERIYRWQGCPDRDHSKPWVPESIGHRTLREWPDVRNSIDNSQPITLTLITSSNDVNPFHLSNNHRVVAYAYEERSLYDWEWVRGKRHPEILHVTILIYDPNYPNDDDVCLTFYTGCDDSWIGLNHNRGLDTHGFFLDDKSRPYANNVATALAINSCEQTGISSATRADYRLKFSWSCRFIPYFCILVDDIKWKYNDTAKSIIVPGDKDNKQCQTINGNMSVNLKLPRDLSKVSVRLLDSEDYTRSVDIDVRPAITCYPYVHNSRVQGNTADNASVCVFDSGITDQDLFIKDLSPTEAEVQQLDTSPFCWILGGGVKGGPVSSPFPNDMTKTEVKVVEQYRLGNLKAPILGDFVEKNLVPPTELTGWMRIIRVSPISSPSMPQSAIPLPVPQVLSKQAQKIFDGFNNNPIDYDQGSRVEFHFESKDKFGVVAKGNSTFYGKSIIYDRCIILVKVFDPGKLAKLEDIGRRLIEMGLVDFAFELPHVPERGRGLIPPRVPTTGRGPLSQRIGGRLQASPVDSTTLLRKLRSHTELQGMIKQTLNALWADTSIWKAIGQLQLEISKQVEPSKPIWTEKTVKCGELRKEANDLSEAEQRKYDAAVTNTFAQKAIEQLGSNPAVIEKLKSLKS